MRIAGILILLAISLASGEYMPLNLAERVAESRITADGFWEKVEIAEMFSIYPEAGETPVAHVFLLNPEGYIITSAESGLPPVTAYSFRNSLMDPFGNSPMTELARLDLTRRVAGLNMFPEDYTRLNSAEWASLIDEQSFPGPLPEQWPPEGSTPTDGWLEENWTQNAPYNAFCPMDLIAGSRSAAGCPAVAMGAILNFHRLTNGTRFSDGDDYYHNYNEYYWIDDDWENHDFPSWTELNTLLDTLEVHFSTGSVTNQDRAAIVYASGAALKQVYTASVSGTFGVDQAFDAYIRFGFDSCELLQESADSLYERLAGNMMEAKPAHLAIIDEVPQYGHNVVVDGYNTDGYFHLNFGWGGSSNGWYSFPLSGMPYGMNIIEGVVLDIEDPLMSSGGSLPSETGLVAIESLSCPVSSVLTAVVSASESIQADVTIRSICGRSVGRLQAELYSGCNTITFAVENLPSGVYVFTASYGGFSDSSLFTVLR